MFQSVNWPLKRIDKVKSCCYQWYWSAMDTVLTWNNSSCPALHLIFSNTPPKKSNTLSFLSMTVKFLKPKEIGSNCEGRPHLLCWWPLHGQPAVLKKTWWKTTGLGLEFSEVTSQVMNMGLVWLCHQSFVCVLVHGRNLYLMLNCMAFSLSELWTVLSLSK
jgi:hypothetical protein